MYVPKVVPTAATSPPAEEELAVAFSWCGGADMVDLFTRFVAAVAAAVLRRKNGDVTDLVKIMLLLLIEYKMMVQADNVGSYGGVEGF